MSFLGYQERVRDGDTVIIFFGHNSMKQLKMLWGNTTQTKFGALRHGDIIGKKYGSRICTLGGKGWVYVLHPTPELWTVNLPHRTQVLYFPDISLVTTELELKPGSVVVEAGTGSGSVSHAIARTIAPSGHLYTFEFHEQRAQTATEEFREHGLSDIITTTFRDVGEDGFKLEKDYVADAVFLDLPSPWTVIPHAKKVLKSSGGRICSFSPCIEQVQRACVVLDELGFTDIKTVECLMRSYGVRTINLNLPNLGAPRSKEPNKDKERGKRRDGEEDKEDRKRRKVEEDPDGKRLSGEDEKRKDEMEMKMEDEMETDEKEEEEKKEEEKEETIKGCSNQDGGKTKGNGASGANDASRAKSAGGALLSDLGGFYKYEEPQPLNRDTYSKKCAVPQWESPGHTGYLTFATLYSQTHASESS